MTSTWLRVVTALVAFVGVLGGLAFAYSWEEGRAWRHGSLGAIFHFLTPYLVVAAAAVFCANRALARLTLATFLAIPAFGVWTCASYASASLTSL